MDKKQKKRPGEELLDDNEVTGEEELVTQHLDAECNEKLDEAIAKYHRALADYQNLEKRVKEERSELVRTTNKDLLLRFLPILDTLILAEQHVKDDTLKVSVDQFLSILSTEGVNRMETVGKKFDPYTMEVVTTTEGKEGVVMQEVRAGYLLHDKLLRAAQVIVGKESN